MPILESPLDPQTAIVSEICPPGKGWMHLLKRGQTLRIEDLEGNQAVDTLFYSAANPEDRYSATNTVARGDCLYLTAGSRLISEEGNVLAAVVADTCGRHDTIGGACSAESNTVRYALDKRPMHSCRDTFLHQIENSPPAMPRLSKRDLTANVNFFMNVPVTPDGGLKFEDGISAPGKYVEVRAEIDLVVLISNCPQLNNPCNAYNPTPIRLLIWDTDYITSDEHR